MPTFRTAPSSSLTEAVRRLVASSRGAGLSPLDEIKADQAAADTAHKMSLVEKVRAEVEQGKAEQQMRADPARRTEFAAHSAGINLPEATQLSRHIRGEMDANPQGAEDPAGNLYGDVQVGRPANLPAGSERLFRNALAAAQANLLGTGKTNAAQLTEASGNVQTQSLVQAVQDAIAKGDFQGASAISQGAKPGTAIKLHENIGTTGATFAPASGDVSADPSADPGNVLLARSLAEAEAKAARDRASAAHSNAQAASEREGGGGGKPPSGYRRKPDGSLEAIPGGPADTKLQGQFNQDTAALGSMQSDLDRLAAEASRLKGHPGLSKATGAMAFVPGVGGAMTIPGTDAANFKAGLETLKSQVAFGVLQNMRNNSKTGGALGQVSDKEGQLLMANLAALDRAQSVDEFTGSLDRILKYTESAKDRLREAYNLKHGNSSKQRSAAAAPAARPATNAKGWKLMKDAKGNQAYVSPDGQQFEEAQ